MVFESEKENKKTLFYPKTQIELMGFGCQFQYF